MRSLAFAALISVAVVSPAFADQPAPAAATTPIPPRLVAVFKCESGFNAHAQNRISSASGLGQDVDGTWREGLEGLGYNADTWKHAKDAPPEIQRSVNVYLLGRHGTKPWECAKHQGETTTHVATPSPRLTTVTAPHRYTMRTRAVALAPRPAPRMFFAMPIPTGPKGSFIANLFGGGR